MPNEIERLKALVEGKGEVRDDVTRLQELVAAPPVSSQSELNVQSSAMQQGFKGDSQYDKGLTFGSNQNNLRAKNQPLLDELANAASSAIINVVPQTLGNLAAIADIEDYYNTDKEVGNQITRAMMDFQKEINADVVPIYQADNVDMGSQEYWTSAGRDLTTSIGSFVLTGMATGGVLNGLSKGASLIKGLNSLGEAGKAVAAVVQASALNQAEGIQSAIGVYDTTYQEKLKLYANQENAEDLARQDAAAAAALTINVNRLTIPLNLTSGLAFLRTPGTTRALIENPGMRTTLKNIIGEGIQESAEEEINLIAEKAGSAKGAGKDYGVNEIIGNIFSKEGFASGLLGFIGGAGQTALTAGVNRINGTTAEQQSRYDAQQASIAEINNILTQNNIPSLFDSFKTANDQIGLNNDLQDAQQSGNAAQASSIGHTILAQQSYSAFTNGTAGVLLDTYKQFASLTAEQAAQQGLDINPRSEEYYVLKAQKAQHQIEKLEKIYNKIPNLPNKEQVFYAQTQRLQLNNRLSELSTQEAEAQRELMAEKVNRGVELDLDNSNPVTQKLQSYKELQAILEQKKFYQEAAIKLDDRLDYIQSPKYIVDKQTQAEKEASDQAIKDSILPASDTEANAADMAPESKQEASEFIASDFSSPEDVASAVSELNPETLANPIIAQQAEIKSQQAVQEAEARNVYEGIQARRPETINDGAGETEAIRLDIIEQEMLGTTHSHVQIEGNRVRFVSDISESVQEPQEIEVSENILPVEEDDFLTSLHAPIEPSDYTYEALENSKERDEQKGIIGTTVRQFELKGKGLSTTIPLKNGLPIETTGLQTPGGVPFDFKTLNSPDFNVGQKVYLTYMPTTYGGTTYETIFVNYRNEIGDLIPVSQINTQNVNPAQVSALLEAVKTQEVVETTISEKYIDKTNRVGTEMSYSLTDLALNSPQHLPQQTIFIGQMFKGEPIISNIPFKSKPSIKTPKIPEGRSFVLLTDPRGNVYADVLFQNPSKDVEIGGRSADQIVINRLNDFMNQNGNLPLREMKTALEAVKAELGDFMNIGRRKYNTFNVGVDLNPATQTNDLYLNVKGTKTFDRKEINRLIGQRPLAIKAEALAANKPFTIDGVNFASYVDFLVSTKAVATNIYTKQPFRDARIKIDLNPVLDPTYQNNPRKVELGAKYGTPKFRLNVNELDATQYQIWNKAQELAWIQTNLPQIPVNIVENTTEMYKKFGIESFGAFQDGVIYLANNTESGTLYHEAFHSVFTQYLSPEEQSTFLKGITEEELAEQFRSYNLTDGLIKPSNNALVRFFQDIYVWTKNLLGLDLINNLFYKINSGGFAGAVNQYQFGKDAVESISNMVTKAGEANLPEISEYVGMLSQVDDFRSTLFSAINENIVESYNNVTNLLQNSTPLENYFRTLPSGDLNSLGYAKPVDFDEFYSQLSELVKNTESAEEMVNTIIQNSLSTPALSKIAEDLNGLNANIVSQMLWENFSTIETVAQKRLNNAGVDTNIKFDTSNISTSDDAYASFESGVIPAIGGAAWNIPVLEGEVFLPDGNIDTESAFFGWFTEKLQQEYAAISTNANRLFKRPDEASQNISDYTAKTFEVLNDLTWIQTPKKITDVNLVDLKVIDFNDPLTLSAINDFLIANFSRERGKLKIQDDTFIANSIYSATEATNLLFPEGLPIDLATADTEARNKFTTPPIASNEVIPVENNITDIASVLQDTAEDESLKKAYDLISIADGEVDTVLPIDFPTIAENSLNKIVGVPLELQSAELNVENLAAIDKEIGLKYSGKKNWWSPSYQMFLNKLNKVGRLNNNSFTANVINQLGNQELAIYFVNQPIIKDLTESYFETANLQASVNQITKDYKMDFISVNEIYDYVPKEFALQDLRDKAGDFVDVLKTFISYKLKETTIYPESVSNFSDYSPNFEAVRTKISSLFGKDLTEEETRFINQEYKTYQLSRPGTFLDMTDSQKVEALSDFPDVKTVSTQELWDRYAYGNLDEKLFIENYLRADIMKKGLHNGIHSNFIIQLGLNEDFRNIKRTFDIEPTSDVLATFIDQFVRNNYQTLNYIQKGNSSQTNKPLYLVSDDNLFKFVDNEFVEQPVSPYRQYSYNNSIDPVVSQDVDGISLVKQNLITEGVQLQGASDEDIVRELKRFCTSI
jgi:hypothetical protein